MELTNEKGEIICQVCGKEMDLMVPAHLKMHGMTMTEYKEKYPNAPMSSDAFKARQQYRHRGDVFKETEPEVPIEYTLCPCAKEPL